MPKFAFRLDPVLDYRKRLEDEQQIVFAAALAELRAAEAARDDYIARRGEMHRAHSHRAHARWTGSNCARPTRTATTSTARSVAQQLVVNEVRVKVERERAKLVVKTTDKKVLEVAQRASPRDLRGRGRRRRTT